VPHTPHAPYDLPTTVSPTSPLTDPAHSTLHNDTGAAINSLHLRVSDTEEYLDELIEPDGPIDQARLVAHTFLFKGAVTTAAMSTKPLILPIVWNVTGRTVVFWAAKATVFSPANADLDIDVVVGSSVTGPNFDAGAHTSVLTAGKLTIPSGQYFSTTTVEAGFNASQPVESYMAVYVKDVHGATTAAVDLCVQVNRKL